MNCFWLCIITAWVLIVVGWSVSPPWNLYVGIASIVAAALAMGVEVGRLCARLP